MAGNILVNVWCNEDSSLAWSLEKAPLVANFSGLHQRSHVGMIAAEFSQGRIYFPQTQHAAFACDRTVHLNVPYCTLARKRFAYRLAIWTVGVGGKFVSIS